MSSKRATVAIGHEASATGAPMQLLTVAGEWVEEGLPLTVVLRRGGSLLQTYRDVVTTHSLTPEPATHLRGHLDRLRLSTAFDGLSIRRGKAAAAIREAEVLFVNSGVNGDLMPFLPRRPTVTWVHERAQFLRSLTSRGSIRRLASNGRRLVAVSDVVRTELSRELDIAASAIEVVHPCAPPRRSQIQRKEAREHWQEPGEPHLLVGACGSLSWEKSPSTFLEIAQILKAHGFANRVRLLWLGGPVGEATRLRELARQLAVDDVVTFLGRANDPTPFFAALDVFAVVSRSDAFPVAALEAGREGVPTVCFRDGGGIREFVRGDAGVVVGERTASAFAHEIERLADDPGKRRELGQTAAARVRAEHSPRRTAEALHSLIDEAADH